MTPSNSRSNSPKGLSQKKFTEKNEFSSKNRDTLVNEDFKIAPVKTKSSSGKNGRSVNADSPAQSTFRSYANESNPSATQTDPNGISKKNDSPPELPPKTKKTIVTANKPVFIKASNSNGASKKPSGLTSPAPAPAIHIPIKEASPVQRAKSRNNRKRITEQEAIEELGKLDKIHA